MVKKNRKNSLKTFSGIASILFVGIVSGYIIGKLDTSPLPFSHHISEVSEDKKIRLSPSSNVYFVIQSPYYLSIRKDIFIEDKTGDVYKGEKKGIIQTEQIGFIDTSKTKSSIMNPIWSSDGKKIAFAILDSSQAQQNKYLFSLYTVNQNGKDQKKVGEYLADTPQELVLVGYSSQSNTISFYGFGGLPTAVAGSFSILDVNSGKISNISSIPLNGNTLKIISSEDGRKFLIAEKTRLYSFNLDNNQLTAVYTIPSADENAYREGIRGDGMFSFNSPKITVGGMDQRGMYFTDKDKVDFYYEFTKQQYYNPVTNSVEKPQ